MTFVSSQPSFFFVFLCNWGRFLRSASITTGCSTLSCWDASLLPQNTAVISTRPTLVCSTRRKKVFRSHLPFRVSLLSLSPDHLAINWFIRTFHKIWTSFISRLLFLCFTRHRLRTAQLPPARVRRSHSPDNTYL